MAGTSELDVGYVARLARINLTEEEANAFQKQLDDVLKYVEKLRQADVSRVEAAAHALPIFNVFREDDGERMVYGGTSAEQCAPKGQRSFYRPKVVE